jgi:hypothetical protein
MQKPFQPSLFEQIELLDPVLDQGVDPVAASVSSTVVAASVSSTLSEPTPPARLSEIQEAITRDLIQKSTESQIFISPSKTLSSDERVTIYIDDYWGRVLESLTEDFPLLEAYLGEETFEEWITSYLQSVGSRQASLFPLGDRLESFFHAEYTRHDRVVVLDMIRYEWARDLAFFAPHLPALIPSELPRDAQDALTSTPLIFQPHVSVVMMSHDILSWSKTKSGRPKEHRKCVLVYRHEQAIKEEIISYPVFCLLKELQSGVSLEQVFDRLETSLKKTELTQLGNQIQYWFSFLVKNQLLSCKK